MRLFESKGKQQPPRVSDVFSTEDLQQYLFWITIKSIIETMTLLSFPKKQGNTLKTLSSLKLSEAKKWLTSHA